MKPYPIHCVSIVIPVYNEEESLPELLRRTTAACKQLAYEYEIILVDDGSRDKSAQMLEDAAAEDGSNVVAVILNRNYGQHAAIMAGFEQCRGEVVITLDADLQNPPEEIPRLVEQAALGYDVVATVRNNRQDSAFRRWPSRLINLAVFTLGVVHEDFRGVAGKAVGQDRNKGAALTAGKHRIDDGAAVSAQHAAVVGHGHAGGALHGEVTTWLPPCATTARTRPSAAGLRA